MDKIIFSADTALGVLMKMRQQNTSIIPAKLPLCCKCPTQKSIDEAGLKNADLSEIHVLVSDGNEVRISSPLKQHFVSGLRYGIVVSPVHKHFLLTSPAFTLAQIAKTLSFWDLFSVAMHLGGTYAINSEDNSILSNRQVMLTKAQLAKMVDQLTQKR